MREVFTEYHKLNKLHEIELEDMMFYADCIEHIDGENKVYKLNGTAVIDGECYNGITVVFETVSAPKSETIPEIMLLDWEWYDYEFI